MVGRSSWETFFNFRPDVAQKSWSAHIEPSQDQTPDAPDLGRSPSEISGGSGFADDPQARTYGQGRHSGASSRRHSASERSTIGCPIQRA